jgi:hypothetical protein
MTLLSSGPFVDDNGQIISCAIAGRQIVKKLAMP